MTLEKDRADRENSGLPVDRMHGLAVKGVQMILRAENSAFQC